MNNLLHTILFTLPLLVILHSCVPEAPRSNPFDPELSSDNSKAILSGTVFTRYQPARPLKNAIVELQPALKIHLTNEYGVFRFDGLAPGAYQLIARKNNYLPDTLTVTITEGERREDMNLFLDALPQILKTEFYSEHIDQWWPGEFYHAFLTIIVVDSDGLADIDSLIYHLPEFNFRKEFERTSRADSFVAKIEDIELPQETLQHLIEHPSYVYVRDESGGTTSAGPIWLLRIIEEAPAPLSPSNLQVVSPSPLLEWQPVSLPFAFTYIVQVFRVTAGLSVLIHTSQELSPDQSVYTFPDSLSSGTYFWTIGVRDNLKNFSRSKEASFIVP